MNTAARTISEVSITAIAGFAAFIAPVMLAPPTALPKAPLFPIVREAVEHLRPASFIAIAIVGFFAGLLARTHWPLLGLATVAMLPVCMAAELFVDPTSHNLFPIELVMYAAFSIPAILTAALGRLARKIVSRSANTRDPG
jgi:hypothetical protein